VTHLFDILRRVGHDLDAQGVGWALVGGLAVSARSEPRFTRDIDVAVTVADDAAAEALVNDLRARGYALQLTLEQQALGRLATVRLTPPPSSSTGVIVDLLFASSGIEGDICAAAERLDVDTGLVVPVARSGHLAVMKLLSRAAHRLQDEIDLSHLAAVLTRDDVALARMGAARIEALGANRGRLLVAELDAYLAAYGLA
jgi:predicted nucleotidyltransferase